MIYLNDFSAYTSVHYGDTSISKVYAGDNQVWPVQPPTPPSYENQYLTFEVTSGTCYVSFAKGSSACTLNYSIDNGSTWQAYKRNVTISSGERILFKGDFKNGDKRVGILRVSGSGRFDVYGNIMSLLYGDDFVNKTSLTIQNIFESLFYGNTGLTNAKNLILPATTLSYECYYGMLSYCTNLITAPALPATTLAESCYYSMFYGCTSLTTAPVLPATTLADSCYLGMFSGCTNLTEITCLATDISAGYCAFNWVRDVSSSGTFYKNPSMTSWPTGDSGIPNGWTVVDYSS